jgi:hypothetical protein
MHVEVSGVLATLVALFALIAILGTAYVYFRGSADKATIEAQGRLLIVRGEEITDLTTRVRTSRPRTKDSAAPSPRSPASTSFKQPPTRSRPTPGR